MNPEEIKAKEELESSLNSLAEITAESLIRTDELGTALDFSKGTPVFERTLKLFRDLKNSNLENIPFQTLMKLKQSTDQALNSFQQIQQFNPAGQNNPAQVRDRLIQEIADQYYQHFTRITPIIAYSVRKGTDFEALEQEARRTLNELHNLKDELEKSGQNIVSEAEAILEQVRRAAAQVGVAQHAVHFREEAKQHKSASNIWLIATGVLALITIGYGVWNVWYYMTHEITYTTSRAIQVGISKIIIFGVLYYAVTWAGRMYRAQMHNYVVNKHRQNALSSFETFVKAASDSQTKDAVLVQATQSIFAPQSSAFSSGDPETITSPTILEIIRGVTSVKPPTT